MAPETPKAVSSRLLTMKFMQRAVASGSSSPDTTESHSSKKRKLNHSPAQGRVSTFIDQAAIQAALDDQEAKRQAALAQHSEADSRWILNTTLDKSKAGKNPNAPLNIVYVGYGDIDSSNESGGEDTPQSGRTSTRKTKGNKNPKDSKPQAQTKNQACSNTFCRHLPLFFIPSLTFGQKSASEKWHSNSEDDSSDDSSSDSDDSSPKRKSRHSDVGLDSQERSSQSRTRSKFKLSQESKKAKDFREKRKKKEVQLNQISSISNSNGTSSPSLTCYKCKQPGHKAFNCPKGGS